jgi:tetratricopeptide (TPR) repeat protein
LFFRVIAIVLTQTLSILFAGDNLENVEDLIKDKQYKKLANELLNLSSRDSNHPTALFALGLVESDGAQAIQYFNRIIQEHHNSPFADDALFRIAQYYYSQGNYKSSKGYFSLINRHYSSSKYKDESQYLYCQCLQAQGLVDSAKVFLKAFIKNVPQSPYVDYAVLDLEDLFYYDDTSQNTKNNILGSTQKYSIQVGAFSERKNAQKFISRLNERKIPTEIVRKNVDGRGLWAVWIGKFSTKEKANDYAKDKLKQIFDDYQIVVRDS